VESSWARPGAAVPHDAAKNEIGVGNGNRTRNRRSHSPVLCQLSYSHRNLMIIAIARTRGTARGEWPLDSSDADVFEAQGAQAGGVEQVLGIDDDRSFEQVLDAIEVEGAELGPAGAHDQSVGALGDRIG
jgi:hypothetical protein